MLEISWKSFGNHCWPCFEVVKNLSTPLVIFGSRREIFGSCWKPLAIFRTLPKSSAIFRSRRLICGNSDGMKTKNLTHLTEKKLAGISLVMQFNYVIKYGILHVNLCR